MRVIIPLIVGLLVIGVVTWNTQPIGDLPPGYEIVCSVDGSRYAMKHDGYIGVNTWMFKRMAAMYAWHWWKAFDSNNPEYTDQEVGGF